MSKVDVVSAAVTPRLKLNLVARVDIPKDDVIFACLSSEITSERTWRTIQLGFGRHVKNEFLDYVDHSCDPNALFDVERLAMVAIRPIQRGEPITFFYPGAEVELAQGFDCACGHAACIGSLKGGFYLTAEQMQWALQRGFCTSFMREQFVRLLQIAAQV